MRRYTISLCIMVCFPLLTLASIHPEPTAALYPLNYKDYTTTWWRWVESPIDRRSVLRMAEYADALMEKQAPCRDEVLDLWLDWMNVQQRETELTDQRLLQVAHIVRIWAVKYSLKECEFRALRHLGFWNDLSGRQKKSLKYYEKCESMLKKVSTKNLHLEFWNEYGTYAFRHDQYLKAGQAFEECVLLAKEMNNHEELAIAWSNLGSVYMRFQDFPKALTYFRESLSIRRADAQSNTGLLTNYNNIGSIHKKLQQNDSAIYYLESAVALSIHLKDKHSEAIARCNLGAVLLQKGEEAKSILELRKAKKYFEVNNISAWLGYTQVHLYDWWLAYRQAGDIKKLKEIYLTAKAMGNADLQQRCLLRLAVACENDNDWSNALKYHQEGQRLKDSLKFYEAEKSLMKLQLQRSLQKEKLLVDKKFNENMDVVRMERKEQRTWMFSIAGGLFLSLGFVLYFHRQAKLIRFQRKRIMSQHRTLVESHQDVQDSIAYAQKIQSAILPFVEDVQEVFPKSFMIYRPKDVVAGDFYWIQEVDDGMLFAVADCTGHGVPGAMVSVVCINALNRCVREFGLTDPGEILTQSREIIIAEFEQAHVALKDGMDIALCKLTESNVEYAGANNPLWLWRAGELYEYQPSKQPIGQFIRATNFDTHHVELRRGDRLYLFTDGVPDLFGGPKNKKLKKSGLRQWIQRSVNLTMNRQGKAIEAEIDRWVQGAVQVDDICFLGVEV